MSNSFTRGNAASPFGGSGGSGGSGGGGGGGSSILWGTLSGNLPDQTDLVNYVSLTVSNALTNVNRVPVTNPHTGTVQDYASSIVGNAISDATDMDGDSFTVTGVTYASTTQVVGTAFNTQYGVFTIALNGDWTYTVGDAGHALTTGQTGVDVIMYRVTDSRGGVSVYRPITLTVHGTDEAPIASAKGSLLPFGQVSTGNVLTGDYDPEGTQLQVTSFQVAGNGTVYQAGQTATISGAGTFQLNASGGWTFTPNVGFAGQLPIITYTETDGTNSVSSTISLGIAPATPTYQQTIDWFMSYYTGAVAPTHIAPNPPPVRAAPVFTLPAQTYPAWNYQSVLPNRQGVSATSYDFRVGPGMEYTELREVPWLSLLPGDRVFVYYRDTPYRDVIPLHVRGEPARWIEVIGVRDPVTKALPVLDGSGATEWPAICKVNGSHTGSGMVHIIQPLDGRSNTNYKPGYIHVHGFEIRNVISPSKLTNYTGLQTAWGGFAAGVKIMGGDRITLSGCMLHNNSLGMFANSTPNNGERFVTRFLHVLFNYFYDNGVIGDYSTHNAYNEAIGALYEFNYFDPVKTNNYGDLIKERSSGQVFRYNYFHSGAANAVSLRDPSSTYQLAQTSVDNYGVSLANFTYMYSNTFYQDNPQSVISYGDGIATSIGQVRGGGKLFFYKNRVIAKFNGSIGFFANLYYESSPSALFDMWNTIADTTVVARNNLLYSDKATSAGTVAPLGVFRYQGVPQFQDNIAHNVQPVMYLDGTPSGSVVTQGTRYAGTMTDLNLTNVDTDQGFVSFATNDFSLIPGSPFYSLNATDPTEVTLRSLASQGNPVNYPFNIAPVPFALSYPTVTGNPVVGNTLTAAPGTFSPYPDSVVNQWLRDGVVISG